MKASKAIQPAFQPVTLVLESQQEVDAVFAAFNFTPIAQALEVLENPLEGYNTDGYNKFHIAILSQWRGEPKAKA